MPHSNKFTGHVMMEPGGIRAKRPSGQVLPQRNYPIASQASHELNEDPYQNLATQPRMVQAIPNKLIRNAIPNKRGVSS